MFDIENDRSGVNGIDRGNMLGIGLRKKPSYVPTNLATNTNTASNNSTEQCVVPAYKSTELSMVQPYTFDMSVNSTEDTNTHFHESYKCKAPHLLYKSGEQTKHPLPNLTYKTGQNKFHPSNQLFPNDNNPIIHPLIPSHPFPLLYRILMLHKLAYQQTQNDVNDVVTDEETLKNEDNLFEWKGAEETMPLDLSIKATSNSFGFFSEIRDDDTENLNKTSNSTGFDAAMRNSKKVCEMNLCNKKYPETKVSETDSGLHLLSECSEMMNQRSKILKDEKHFETESKVSNDKCKTETTIFENQNIVKKKRKILPAQLDISDKSNAINIKKKMTKIQKKYFKIYQKLQRIENTKEKRSKKRELNLLPIDGKEISIPDQKDITAKIINTSSSLNIKRKEIFMEMVDEKVIKRKYKYKSNDNNIHAKSNTIHNDVETDKSNSHSRVCNLTEDVLNDGLRVLLIQDGLFYPGRLSEIISPDIYGVLVDKERGNKPHVYSREEVIREVIHDLRPQTVSELKLGTRVCAFWSNKMNYLHPGIVAGPDVDPAYVFIQLDDGDSRDMHIDQVRYIPEDYPFVAPDQKFVTGFIGSRKRVSSAVTPTLVQKKKSFNNSTEYKKQTKHKRKKKKNKDCELSVSVSELSDKENKITKKYIEPALRDYSTVTDDDQNKEDQEMDPLLDERISAFLPPQHLLWSWADEGRKLSTKSRKIYHDIIKKDGDTLHVGECAVFLSTGRPDRPYIGHIHSMWQTSVGSMKVQVRWFYHLAEVEGTTVGGGRVEDIKTEGALFDSSHFDENNIYSISHKCQVLELDQFKERQEKGEDQLGAELFYLAGEYDPVEGVILFRQGVFD